MSFSGVTINRKQNSQKLIDRTELEARLCSAPSLRTRFASRLHMFPPSLRKPALSGYMSLLRNQCIQVVVCVFDDMANIACSIR